jgi:hypothetical protein
MMRLTEDNFRGSISALFAAETTCNDDRLEREAGHSGGNAETTSFARDNELLAPRRTLEHGNRIAVRQADVIHNYRRRLRSKDK